MCLRRKSMAFYWNSSETFSNCVSAEVRLILLKLFQDVLDFSPSPNSFAWCQKCCKAFPNCVTGKNQWHPIEIILRHFQIVSQPKFDWILLKLFQVVFESSPSPNSFAWYQKCFRAFPKSVLGENQWHPIENILRRLQVLSQRNLSWNLLNFF